MIEVKNSPMVEYFRRADANGQRSGFLLKGAVSVDSCLGNTDMTEKIDRRIGVMLNEN